jgi:hypothetical protein
MDNEEKDLDVEQETVEEEETTEETETPPEETVTLTKEKFKAMQEKAIKFDESLKKPKTAPSKVTPELDNATVARIYGVHEDDIEEILDLAKFKKLSLAETLKTSVAKTIIAEKEEFRKTAQMSNTGKAKTAAPRVSEDTLLANLSKGEVPKPGSAEAEALFWARRGGKR